MGAVASTRTGIWRSGPRFDCALAIGCNETNDNDERCRLLPEVAGNCIQRFTGVPNGRGRGSSLQLANGRRHCCRRHHRHHDSVLLFKCEVSARKAGCVHIAACAGVFQGPPRACSIQAIQVYQTAAPAIQVNPSQSLSATCPCSPTVTLAGDCDQSESTSLFVAIITV